LRTQTSIARTSKATLTLERSDLLRVVFDDKAQVSLADAQQMVSAARRLTSGDRLPMLIDATRCSHINKDVRRHLQGEEAQSITYACAILAPMTAKSMIRNLLFDIDVADCIFRFFADERKAVRWLDEQRRAAEEGAAP